MAAETDPGIDLELLHWHLWERRNRNGQVSFSHRELAEGMGVTRGRVSQVIGDMEAAGRIAKTASRGRYTVKDPASG